MKLFKYFTFLLFILLFFSCSEKEPETHPYSTWKSRKSSIFETEVPGPDELPE